MLTIPDAIKEKLHLDSCKKNIRIHFPKGERSDICNDLIVKDSVKFSESLCSQDKLRFGLCESPQFECETVGVGNIKGALIEVFCEVYCDSDVDDAVWRNDLQAWVYPIPYGFFTVNSCERQTDVLHRKIVAYGGNVFLSTLDPLEAMKEDDPYWSAEYTPKAAAFTIVNAGFFAGNTDLFDRDNLGDYDTDTEDFSCLSWVPESGDYAGHTLTMYLDSLTTYTFNSSRHESPGMDNMYEIRIESMDNLLKSWQFMYDLALEYGCSEQYANLYKKEMIPYWTVMVAPSGGGTSYFPSTDWHTVGDVERYLFYGRRSSGSVLEIEMPANASGLKIIDETTGNELYNKLWTSIPGRLSFRAITACVTFKSDYSFFATPRLSFPALYDDDTATYRHDFTSGDTTALRMSAMMELLGVFGYIGRDGIFQMIDIKRKYGLHPNTNLYPSETLYPDSAEGECYTPNDYQSCWYSEEFSKPFGRIVCDYTNTNGNKKTYSSWIEGYYYDRPKDSYLVYDISDNFFIQSYQWSRANIVAICNLIKARIKGVSYVPVNFVGRGLPYVEPGDTFEVLTTNNDSITTIVLDRTISGEQNLTDSFKSV